jgi:predicted nucleotidyltransferase
MKYNLEDILSQLKTKYNPDIEDKLLLIWLGGSRLYGTASEESDWDFTAITSVPVKPTFPQEKQVFNFKCVIYPLLAL